MRYEHHSQRLLPFRKFLTRLLTHVGIALAIVAGSLVAGMAGYHWIAGMSWVDSFVDAAMILGGMGPVGELTTDSAKIFAGCYALYAGVVFIAVAGLMIAPIAHRVMHRLHVRE